MHFDTLKSCISSRLLLSEPLVRESGGVETLETVEIAEAPDGNCFGLGGGAASRTTRPARCSDRRALPGGLCPGLATSASLWHAHCPVTTRATMPCPGVGAGLTSLDGGASRLTAASRSSTRAVSAAACHGTHQGSASVSVAW